MLWQHLRNKQLHDLKFYRQYSIGPYILDFFCPALNLAIELDGKTHDAADAKNYDKERSEYLKGFSIKVLRFRNDEVVGNIDRVLDVVRSEAPS